MLYFANCLNLLKSIKVVLNAAQNLGWECCLKFIFKKHKMDVMFKKQNQTKKPVSGSVVCRWDNR